MSMADVPVAADVAALAPRDTFARDLGIDVIEAAPGRAVTRVRVEARHVNFNGVCHGGLTFTLADAAFGYACNSHGVMSAGIDVHMMYNTAARVGDILTATAVEIALSAKLSNYRIDVVRADGTLIAGMSGTAFITGKPAAA
jgi:acyl-CoA thioesterase